MQAYQGSGLYTAGVKGAGQTIAIVIDAEPTQNDLQHFWTTYGIPQSFNNITMINVQPKNGLAQTSGEETLDVEWSSSIAPQALVRVYASYDLTASNLDLAYQAVYNDVTSTTANYNIHQMSLSYGIPETETTGSLIGTDDQYFAELAAAGVTICVSTGDGASTPGPGGYADVSGALQVEQPSSDPNVMAVGGTTLQIATTGAVSSESAWTYGGGGASIYFNRPAWQTGNGVPSGTMRLVPDVSSAADPNFGAAYYFTDPTTDTVTTSTGGTSWSSPTWVGFCALINQSRALAGFPPIGLLGPRLYSLIGTSNFRDIITGNNSIGSNSGGHYSASAGYDEATGIGVPNVQTLAQTLSTVDPQKIVTIQPSTIDLLVGQNGTFTATATGSPVSYQWQRMPFGSTTWSNLGNGGAYSGATSASLTISNVTQAMSGDLFQCLVTYSGNIQVASSSAVSLVVDVSWVVKTFAGQAGIAGRSNGTGTGALFSAPSGIAIDNSAATSILPILAITRSVK